MCNSVFGRVKRFPPEMFDEVGWCYGLYINTSFVEMKLASTLYKINNR